MLLGGFLGISFWIYTLPDYQFSDTVRITNQIKVHALAVPDVWIIVPLKKINK